MRSSASGSLARFVPHLLFALGVVVIALAIALRMATTVTSKTVTRRAQHVVATTTTETPVSSDALLGGALALGGALVLSGAFYRRIRRVTLPGGAVIELARYQAAVADALARTQLPAGLSEAAKVAVRTTAATNLALARAVERTYISVDLPRKRRSSDSEITAETAYWDEVAELTLNDVLREANIAPDT